LINGRDRVTVPDSGRYADYNVFGKTIYRNMAFSVEVELGGGARGDSKSEEIYSEQPQANDTKFLSFSITSARNNAFVPVDLQLKKPLAKVSKERRLFWQVGDYIISYQTYWLRVMKCTRQTVVIKELAYLKNLMLRKGGVARQAAFLRIAYWLTRPLFSRRPIWLFFDKLYKAGDNGEYLYRYALQQKDGIDKRYVLNANCDDAKRFSREGLRYVKAASLKNRLLLLNAQAVFATHVNIPKINGFDEGFEKYFRDLFNYDVMFIQHGLTIQELAQYQHIAFDDTKLYFIASPFEFENLTRDRYGYQPSQIIASGLARYDGLLSEDMRNILISPSWRNYIAEPGVAFIERSRDDSFKATAYYQIYNSLINDPALIEAAKHFGYRITLLLHPIVSTQVEDFEKNEIVDVVASTQSNSYERLLCSSSLLVTDYSGVQFDFAYMRKPVVYFHPPELPPSYDEAVYRYEDDALGEIVCGKDDLVDALIHYMGNGCRIKGLYEERIDSFFYHHDHNNCERIYDAASEYMRKRMESPTTLEYLRELKES
jgi:CDP-glycerol glycerophosphotransferase (TagB/SpsB family)